jgi:hypothetical protein
MIRRDRDKLLKSLGGIKGMNKLPGMVFVVDPAQGAHRRRRGAQARAPGGRRHRHQLRPRRHRPRHPGATTTPSAPSSCSPAASPTRAIIGTKIYKERARHPRGQRRRWQDERVIHVSSGGDGPRVEMSLGRPDVRRSPRPRPRRISPPDHHARRPLPATRVPYDRLLRRASRAPFSYGTRRRGPLPHSGDSSWLKSPPR